MMSTRSNSYHKLWLGLGLLILMSPLGVLLPKLAKAGGAWGEWSVEELRSLLGYVPLRLGQLRGVWAALLPDYSIPGMQRPWQAKLAYLLCTLIGTGVVVAVCLVLGKWLSIPEDKDINRAP
jgi:cobalt/nickel transport protein